MRAPLTDSYWSMLASVIDRKHRLADASLNMDRLQSEIKEVHAELEQLQRMFEGGETPTSLVKLERTILTQLETAEALLDD